MKFSMLWRTRLIGVLFIVLLLVLWEVVAVAKLLPAMSFPRMSLILETLWGLIASGELFAELKPSMIRMFAGYLAGSALGVLVGLMLEEFGFELDNGDFVEQFTQRNRSQDRALVHLRRLFSPDASDGGSCRMRR